MLQSMQSHEVSCQTVTEEGVTVCGCGNAILAAALEGNLPPFVLREPPDFPARWVEEAGGFRVTELDFTLGGTHAES